MPRRCWQFTDCFLFGIDNVPVAQLAEVAALKAAQVQVQILSGAREDTVS